MRASWPRNVRPFALSADSNTGRLGSAGLLAAGLGAGAPKGSWKEGCCCCGGWLEPADNPRSPRPPVTPLRQMSQQDFMHVQQQYGKLHASDLLHKWALYTSKQHSSLEQLHPQCLCNTQAQCMAFCWAAHDKFMHDINSIHLLVWAIG